MNRLNHSIVALLLALAATVAYTAPAVAGPFDNCDAVLDISDGRYGFVWKPTGAHRPQAVVVLQSKFKGNLLGTSKCMTDSVTLYRASNSARIGTLPMKSSGGYGPGTLDCKPGIECLDRPTFAHPTLSGAALRRKYGNFRLRFQSNYENRVHCSEPFNQAVRLD